MKQRYITPTAEIVRMITEENIAQFVISSHSVGEEDALAKPGLFDEEDEEIKQDMTYNFWKNEKKQKV